MFDIDLLGDELARLVRDHAAESTAPLLAQIQALEQKLATLPAPKDGKDADPDTIRQQVAQAIAAIPAPQDGQSVDLVALAGDIAAAAAKAVSALPPGLNGKDGANGLNGKDGAPGPAGQPGADGLQGRDGAAGEPGRTGADGLDGKDGAHGKDADPALVAAMVSKAVAELPQPDDLQAFAAALVSKFTAAEHAH